MYTVYTKRHISSHLASFAMWGFNWGRFARYVASLLYQVKAADPGVLAFPSVIILATALLEVIALRIDPGDMLRAE